MQMDFNAQRRKTAWLLRDYVATKFAKLERPFEQIHNARIVLNVENSLHLAKAKLQLVDSELCATAQHKDMYAAIDARVDTLPRQVLNHSKKLTIINDGT